MNNFLKVAFCGIFKCRYLTQKGGGGEERGLIFPNSSWKLSLWFGFLATSRTLTSEFPSLFQHIYFNTGFSNFRNAQSDFIFPQENLKDRKASRHVENVVQMNSTHWN